MDLTRRMSPAEKLQRAFDLSCVMRQLGEQSMRQKHPGASGREIFLLVAQRQLGNELFRKVYASELADHGSAERGSERLALHQGCGPGCSDAPFPG